MKRVYTVRPIWDEETATYSVESDIDGLFIETKTVEEAREVVLDVAPDLIVHNHMSDKDRANADLSAILPLIVFLPEHEREAA